MPPSEPLAKPVRELRVALDRDHARACVEQSPREHARPGSDVDDELVPRDFGVADESGCQPAATKEVLAASAPGGASSNGHEDPAMVIADQIEVLQPRSRSCACRSGRATPSSGADDANHDRVARPAAPDDARRAHVDVERRHLSFGAARMRRCPSTPVMSVPNTSISSPPIALPSSFSSSPVHPVAPKRSVLIRLRRRSPSARARRLPRPRSASSRRRTTAGRRRPARPTSREHRRVDPPRVAGPAGRLRARQRLDDLDAVGRACSSSSAR